MGGEARSGARWAVAGVVLAIAGLAAVPGAVGQGTPAPCSQDAAHPTPVTVSRLPARVVAGRRESVRVRPRAARDDRNAVLDAHLTALDIRFERITDGEVTFEADLLPAYRKADPRQNIGYEVRLDGSSPGERAIVSWTADDRDGSAGPCSGELSTGDMAVVSARNAERPRISARSGVTDVRHGDSALLRIGGRGSGCALTDPSRLTVVARSAGETQRMRLDMACGHWVGAVSARVDRFTLLAEDGGYSGAARLYVSPRAAPTPGAQLTLAVYKGRRRLASQDFSVTATAAGTPKVVAR